MRWAFWKKETAAVPAGTAAWPADSHAAVEQLAYMYNSLPAPEPFCEWQAPTTRFSTGMAPAAELCVHAYQLATWFRLFAIAHGEVASGFARDAFLALIQDSGGSTLVASTDILLVAIDAAYRSFTDTPPARELSSRCGNDSLLAFGLHLAEALLERFPQQLPSDAGQLEKLRADLARCLSHGQEAAQRIWEPMMAAIGPFNASTYPAWRWSPEPGARERHLQRRRNNPLFAPDRRRVSASDVYYARAADQQDMEEVRSGMVRLFSQVMRLEVPEQWHPYLDGLRSELDDLYERLQEIGGNADVEMLYRTCRSGLMAAWRARLGQDTSTLDHAESVLHAFHESRCGVTCQLTSADKPIPYEEVACSLLSEPAADISKVVASLGPDSDEVVHLRRQGLRIVLSALEEGHTVPDYREKLEALGVTM